VKLAIIDYGSGNLRSAAKAFERAAAEAGISCNLAVTSVASEVAGADRIVLPGVGAFGDCRRGLDSLPGMVETLNEAVQVNGRPFMGICVGMQLMATRGLEHGKHLGLDWIAGDVVPLEPDVPTLKIPHMGWNNLDLNDRGRGHPVLAGLGEDAHAYFVHSFGFKCQNQEDLLATVEYGGKVAAVIGRGNMIGTQFHPEKSQQVGLQIITNFLKWRP
jgi:glutamine amidotransferase